jgi:cobalt/nickel transport system permease protein
VVLTPREWVAAFVAYALVLTLSLAVAKVPIRRVLVGLTIEIPFVLFAVLLPFVGPPPDGVGGLSIAGLWAAWNILIKASLGVLTATLLSATTLPVDLVAGLQSLRMPSAVVAILTFFVRYVDVVADQYTRMRVAQHVRGMRSTSPRSWPVIASGLAALFVRSYERGERVHLALVSRGYDGRLPAPPAGRAHSWAIAAVLPVCAGVIFGIGVVAQWDGGLARRLVGHRPR